MRVYSTPVPHYETQGPVALRLEWEGLSVVYSGEAYIHTHTKTHMHTRAHAHVRTERERERERGHTNTEKHALREHAQGAERDKSLLQRCRCYVLCR